MYALIDCNNSFVSFERVFQPELKGKPVIVLSNNDGCIISRSDEAKALGIKMGAPYYQVQDIIRQHNVFVRSSNYTLYGDMSNRVMNLLREFSPEVEIYSIDEAFLKFEGFENFDFDQIGTAIHKRILKGVGVPVSIGFAPTRALSKLANKIARKFPDRTGNYYIMDSEEKRIKALKWAGIGDIWGIGRKNYKRLTSIGIRTAYDFTQLSDDYVRRHLSVIGLRLKYDLEGKPATQSDEIKDKKHIACTRSFDKMICDEEEMQERISTYVASAAVKLRKQKSNCQAVHVFILSNRHRKDLSQYNGAFSIRFPYPTSSTLEISKWAQRALKVIYKQGHHYKKAGVVLMEISKDESQQLHMFEYENPNHKVLMEVIDRVNHKIGEKIKYGRNDLKRKWKMNRNMLSALYTTQLAQAIQVKADDSVTIHSTTLHIDSEPVNQPLQMPAAYDRP
ncbi:Y-family DNA polymerase [Flavobacterium silvaticum]|uniref:Y-family DNA polymerase n=1 Tax=Flavobacterium silvaticum TaxID=1852020 RepID=A0A972FMM2_9FLAO|nr:Y-family DNA polymerase [Flavobacterium silvaticum]NMH28816.1 Y-family DNA polymerase [Flavobacterium silvaticum]